MKKTQNRKGFTLAELLIVVAIIAVLVAISIPIFSSQLVKARRAVDQANVRSAKAAAAAEYMTNGEEGDVSYIYDGSKAVKLDSSSNLSSFFSKQGYGKSEAKDNRQKEDGTFPTGASGTPKNGYVEVKVDDSDQNQIKASWVSSAEGAVISSTGNYTFSGAINNKSIYDKLNELGVDPKDVTTFTAADNSTIKEGVESDGKGKALREGDLVNTFEQFPNLKVIDLSGATLEKGNTNLFQNLPDSVQEIKLPQSSSQYDIRGKWYYADGQQVSSAAAQGSGANKETDSQITSSDSRKTIYRTKEAATAAGNNSSK